MPLIIRNTPRLTLEGARAVLTAAVVPERLAFDGGAVDLLW